MATQCPKCHSDNPETVKFCGECGTQLVPGEGAHFSKTLTLETQAEGLARGSVFSGRYEILEELGGGGMGKVYRVYDRKLEEEVALKLIRPEIAADRRAIERFKNELKIARKIGHKNVCKMYDLGEANGASFITMEYVAGEDLRSFIRRAKQLTVGASVSIARQVAEGLAEAHRLGVVHRDLKPGNIMIDKEGNAKIMDFGIARSLLGKGLTGEGAIIGTPEYMSPEQVEGREADGRSDIYSLGIILFEMLVGCPPFDGETPFSIANKHKTKPPPIPKKVVPQIPDGLNSLILRCLEKDKAKRFQKAEELVAELLGVEQALPPTDRALTRAKTKIRTSREITVKLTPRKLAVPVIVIGLVLIVAVFWRGFFAKKEPPSAPVAPNSIAFVSLSNQTGDQEYGNLCQRSIPELLITKLESFGRFRVATWQRMMDVLKQLGKRGVTWISEEDGFAICRRAGIKYLCLGTLNKAGDTFAIDLKILEVESKSIHKGFQSRGQGAHSILDSQIDKLGSDISREFGLTAQDAQAPAPRIADVTTSSTEAYQAYLEGVDAFHNWHFEEARSALERAIRIDPTFASAYLNLAATFQRFSDFAAAKKTIVQAERLADRATDKEKLLISMIKAEIFGEAEKQKALIPALEKLVARFPEDKELHFFLGIHLAELANSYDRGIAELRRVLELDPEYAFAYFKISMYSSWMGKRQDAFEYAKKYRALDPTNPFATSYLASLYGEAGRYADAETIHREALEQNPSFDASYLSLAYLAAMREDYPAAAAWLDKFYGRSWTPAVESDARLLNGILDLWRGRYEQGLMEFDRSTWLAEKADNKLLLRLAVSFRAAVQGEKGDAEMGRRDLQRLIDSSTDPVAGSPAWMTSGLVYSFGWLDMNAGQWEAAQKQVDELKTIVSNPGELEAWGVYNPGALKKNISRLQALLECEIAIRLQRMTAEDIRQKLEGNPKPTASYGAFTIYPLSVEYFHFLPPFGEDTLARAYVSEGKLDKAIAAYEKMVKSPPASRNLGLIHPLTHYRLAQVYERARRKKDAATEYRKFLDLWKDADPGLPEVEDARKRLAGL